MTSNTVLDDAYQRLHSKEPEFGGDEEGNHGLTAETGKHLLLLPIV